MSLHAHAKDYKDLHPKWQRYRFNREWTSHLLGPVFQTLIHHTILLPVVVLQYDCDCSCRTVWNMTCLAFACGAVPGTRLCFCRHIKWLLVPLGPSDDTMFKNCRNIVVIQNSRTTELLS